jgi:hypothetical protein
VGNESRRERSLARASEYFHDERLRVVWGFMTFIVVGILPEIAILMAVERGLIRPVQNTHLIEMLGMLDQAWFYMALALAVVVMLAPRKKKTEEPAPQQAS